MGHKTINLALQGGGAHGAFTWGVLDRLIEDGRLDFDGDLRHQRRRDERGGAGRRLRARRRGGRARAAAGVLEGGQPRRRQGRARSAKCLGRPIILLLALPIAGVPFFALAAVVSPYRLQPAEHQSAPRPPRRAGRLRPRARCKAARAVHLGDQCPRPARSRFHRQGGHRRRGDGLGLPALPVPRGRDRRRGLLGRRLHGQSGALPLLRRQGLEDILLVQVNPIRREDVPRTGARSWSG